MTVRIELKQRTKTLQKTDDKRLGRVDSQRSMPMAANRSAAPPSEKATG
jgi:hypothetical protein